MCVCTCVCAYVRVINSNLQETANLPDSYSAVPSPQVLALTVRPRGGRSPTAGH